MHLRTQTPVSRYRCDEIIIQGTGPGLFDRCSSFRALKLLFVAADGEFFGEISHQNRRMPL